MKIGTKVRVISEGIKSGHLMSIGDIVEVMEEFEMPSPTCKYEKPLYRCKDKNGWMCYLEEEDVIIWLKVI